MGRAIGDLPHSSDLVFSCVLNFYDETTTNLGPTLTILLRCRTPYSLDLAHITDASITVRGGQRSSFSVPDNRAEGPEATWSLSLGADRWKGEALSPVSSIPAAAAAPAPALHRLHSSWWRRMMSSSRIYNVLQDSSTEVEDAIPRDAMQHQKLLLLLQPNPTKTPPSPLTHYSSVSRLSSHHVFQSSPISLSIWVPTSVVASRLSMLALGAASLPTATSIGSL